MSLDEMHADPVDDDSLRLLKKNDYSLFLAK
jgi:hypothetical protein